MNDSSKEWILCVCNNRNQCTVALPVARELLSKHGIQTKFLSLDSYYNQGVNAALANVAFPVAELPSRHCAGRYYEELVLRSAFIWEAAVEVHQLFEELRPSAVLLGHDVELIEQLIVREAERRGIRTARIQDGITGPFPVETEVGLSERRLVFEGGCDLLLIWNDYLRDNLIKRKIPGKIVTVGDPRTDCLLAWKSETKDEAPYTVLIAGQIWAKHLTMPFDREVAVYQRMIKQFLARPDTKVIFRPHPAEVNRDVFLHYPELFDGRVEIVESEDLYEIFKRVHVVVAVSSTVTIESAMLGIPTFRLVHLLEEDVDEFNKREDEFVRKLTSEDFPNVSYFGYLGAEEFVRDYAPRFDGGAAARAADELQLLIAENLKSKDQEPLVSVLLVQDEGDVRGAVNSVLRSGSFPLEILVCDTSADASISLELAEFEDDDRVHIYHRPGAKHGAALNELISLSSCDVLLRLGQGCVAFPDWAKNLYEALESQEQARIAISEYGIRDDGGLLYKAQILPDMLSGQELAALETLTLIVQAYAFRKEFAVRLNDQDPNAEGAMITGVIEDMADRSRVAIVHGKRFLTPHDHKRREIAGPQPIVRPPLYSESPKSAVTSNPLTVKSGKRNLAQTCSLVVVAPTVEYLENLERTVISDLGSSSSVDIVIAANPSSQEVRELSHDIIREFDGAYVGHLGQAADGDLRNAAIERARGEIVFFAHPDITLNSESIDAHCRLHRETNSQCVVVGELCLAPRLVSHSLSGALFRNGLLISEGEADITEDILSLEQFHSFNSSIPREHFLQERLRFDGKFLGDWGRDYWLGMQILEQGIEIRRLKGSPLQYEKEWELLDFFRNEQNRTNDMIRLMNRQPELVRSFLEVPAMTSVELTNWETSITEGLPELAPVFEKVFYFLQTLAGGEKTNDAIDTELAASVDHLVQFLCVRQLVRHYLKSPAFAEFEVNGQSI